MKLQRFNTGWEVIPGITDPFGVLYNGMPEGKQVTLPHDAMIEEERDRNCPSGGQSGFYPAKTYTYLKTFTAPAEWAEGRQILEFEGVMGKTAVYINGQFAVHHQNGYSQFYADLTPFLEYGKENSVKVIASNSEYASRWYPGSGIIRDVNLFTGGATRILPEKLRITTEYIEDDYAMVRVDAALESDHVQSKQVLLRVSLYQADAPSGACAASEETEVTVSAAGSIAARLRISVSDPKLWSPDSPDLYRCVAEVIEDGKVIDVTEEEFGIRTLRLDAKKGLRINGKVVKMRGVCIHHDNGIIGATSLYGAEEFRMRNLKDAGVNAIRSAHHPMGKALLRACDRLGMLVMDELSDMWNVPKNRYDRSFVFSTDWEDEIRRMVAKDYNHPCVVLYSTGNEIPEIGTPDGRALHRKIVERIHALDETRYTTAGMNGFLAVAPELQANIDQMKLQAQGEVSEDAGGSDNLNTFMGALKRHDMDAFASSDLLTNALEEASGLMDAAGFNYLTARHELEPKSHPDRVVVGSETFPKEIGTLWDIVERNPHVIGDFTWTGYDYLGEAGIGIFHYDAGGGFNRYPDRIAYCGDINLNGYRRPQSYLREAAYGLLKAPYIAVDRPEHYGQTYDVNGWKYGDAVDSWTWLGYESRPVRIRVIAKADEAELFLNGESLGREPIGEEELLTAYFETVYAPGELTAVVYKDGAECGRSQLVTAGEPAALSVKVVNPELPADGSGVSFLIVETVDKDGVVNRDVIKDVTVSVEGAGTLQGFGSADPSCEGSYQDLTWETYDGRVMAAVRSGCEPGVIKVRFTAEGCEEASAEIRVVPV